MDLFFALKLLWNIQISAVVVIHDFKVKWRYPHKYKISDCKYWNVTLPIMLLKSDFWLISWSRSKNTLGEGFEPLLHTPGFMLKISKFTFSFSWIASASDILGHSCLSSLILNFLPFVFLEYALTSISCANFQLKQNLFPLYPVSASAPKCHIRTVQFIWSGTILNDSNCSSIPKHWSTFYIINNRFGLLSCCCLRCRGQIHEKPMKFELYRVEC